jgi:hypothetical protein
MALATPFLKYGVVNSHEFLILSFLARIIVPVIGAAKELEFG